MAHPVGTRQHAGELRCGTRLVGRYRSRLLRCGNVAAGERAHGMVEFGLNLDVELTVVVDNTLAQAGSLLAERSRVSRDAFCNVFCNRLSAWSNKLTGIPRFALRGRRLPRRSCGRLFHWSEWLGQASSLCRRGRLIDQHFDFVSTGGTNAALPWSLLVFGRHATGAAQELFDLVPQRIGLLPCLRHSTRGLRLNLRLRLLRCRLRPPFRRPRLFIRFHDLPNHPHYEHDEPHEATDQLDEIGQD